MNTQSERRKTIREWEQEYQILILDLDGFDGRDPHLYDRAFSRAEFEQSMASCTVVRRQSQRSAGAAATRPSAAAASGSDQQAAARQAAATSAAEVLGAAAGAAGTSAAQQAGATSATPGSRAGDAPTAPRRRWWTRSAQTPPDSEPLTEDRPTRRFRLSKTRLRLLILFTLPTLATLLLLRGYRLLRQRVSIRWYWPLLVLVLDVFVVIIAPVAPLLSGPLYLWYLLIGSVSRLGGLLLGLALRGTRLGDSAMAFAHHPFLVGVHLFSNPLSLYFTTGAAIASSLVLGSAIASIWQLVRRSA